MSISISEDVTRLTRSASASIYGSRSDSALQTGSFIDSVTICGFKTVMMISRYCSEVALSFIIALALAACSRPRSAASPADPIVVKSADVPPGEVIYPEIVVDEGGGSKKVSHELRFEGKSYKLSFSVDMGVYEGAKGARKTVKMSAESKGVDWEPGYQAALIRDPAQDPFYDALLGKLRAIRDKEKLDSDRYAELIAVFVQSVSYCTEAGQAPKFPVETFVDGCGDCDDKSRLLAGLLSREGYGAVLFIFHDESHMAVGIRSPSNDFKGSGYTYIETTSPAYIGFPSYEYSEVKLHSVPEVIRIGDGQTAYTAASEVAFLHETILRLRDDAEAMKKKLDKSKPEGERLKTAYDEYSEKLKRSGDSLPAAEYNRLAAQANKYGERYNRAVKEHNELARRINHAADIVAYVIEHPDDRRGVYRWVEEQLGR